MKFIQTLCTCLALLAAVHATPAYSQGEDSLPSERDYMVINQMLPGIYSNTNQAYFEKRTKVAEDRHHPSMEMTVMREKKGFSFGIKVSDVVTDYKGKLIDDTENSRVVLRAWRADNKRASCEYVFSREAMQFRARALPDCHADFASGLVLSEKEFWLYPGEGSDVAADNPFRMNRARPMSCYVDMPGVGGGRDIPYERYDNLQLHDQGGTAKFTTRDDPARNMAVTVLLVDWPVNNYEGVFTRDSLVIYVTEELANDESKEHGYAFTVPEADRIGINLKWLLASCFMFSNANATPTM